MLIYDIEIIKAIPPKNDNEREAGIEYCEGWNDHANMGVSTICAYDYEENRYRVFTEDNFDRFSKLANNAEIVIGFNSIKFDNAVCRACGIADIPDNKSYDLLVEIWKGAGLGPKFQYPSHIGFSLDACCRTNFGTEKSGHGALAPVDWQQGKIGTVIDYCLNDVRLTKQLMDRIMCAGKITDPRNTMETIQVSAPAESLRAYLDSMGSF